MHPQIRYRVQGAHGEGWLGSPGPQGLEETATYMDRVGAESGHLVIFDLRPDLPWEQRLYRKDPELGEPPITVWGI